MSSHIIFPATTIGLASYLVVLEGLWLWKKDTTYRDLYHFWSHIFAVNFAMGVVSGIVMAYQFGTNWSQYSAFAGTITGPLLSYEVLTAFFLEAGFLGVALFGWNRVGPGLHFFATIMVAIGTLISAFSILASNSWMQTPQGFEIVNGRVVPVDWLKVIFNPSFPYRLAHMTVAAYLAVALFVGATGAWHLLKRRDTPAVRTMFSMAMWMVLIVAPIQIVIGDQHGLMDLKYQPAKIAAVEGHWENQPGESVPLILFGVPDMNAETTRYAVQIPHLGSLVLTHSWNSQIRGLKDFAPQDRPNSTIVFWTFRIMAGLGFLMLLLGLWGAWARWSQSVVSVEDLSAFRGADGPRRPDRDRGRMADHGDRAPALGGLWRDADEGRGIEPLCARTFGNADRVHRHVCGRLRNRDQLHAQAGSERPAALRRAFAGAEPTNRTSDTSSVRGSRSHRSGDRVAGQQEEIAAMGIDLPVIWAVIIGFRLMMYVVMDGFDLGNSASSSRSSATGAIATPW